MVFKFLVVFLGVMAGPVVHADILTNGLLSSDAGFASYRILEANGSRTAGSLSPDGIAGHIERVADPVNPLRYVAKSTITRDDALIAGGYRSEFSGNEDPLFTERWYGFGFMIPSEWSSTKNSINLFQVHDRADIDESGFRYAAFHMEINPIDQVKVYNAYDADRVTSAPDVHPTANVDYVHRKLAEFSIVRDQWTYFVLNVRWAGDDSGSMNIWKDGEILFSENDHINTYNDVRGPWFKAGTYASGLSTGWTTLSSFSTGVVVGDGGESLASISRLIEGGVVSSVPEPVGGAMFVAGLLMLGWYGKAKGLFVGRRLSGTAV